MDGARPVGSAGSRSMAVTAEPLRAVVAAATGRGIVMHLVVSLALTWRPGRRSRNIRESHLNTGMLGSTSGRVPSGAFGFIRFGRDL
jgi:hypothetical protein